jgi:hypothetical protein
MKFRDLIIHNFRLKVFSVLIALLIWETINLAIKRDLASSGPATAAATNQNPR